MERASARVVKVTRVPLAPQGAATVHREPIELTFFDTFWVKLPPHQRLFLYHTDLPFPSLVDALKASLSATLPRFRSLAGQLTYVPATGDIVIGFSGDDGDGVDVVEAVCEGADFQRLAEDEAHHTEVFEKLVPVTDVSELPAAVFTVQVTDFPGGGVAVGLSLHHVAIDGRALWQFIEAWAAECRRLLGGGGGSGSGVPDPVLDRSVIMHPGGKEVARHYIRLLTPNLPSLANDNIPIPKDDGRRAARRTFTIPAAAIASLRDRGARAGASAARRPTTFVALAAHAWISVLKAKAVPADDQPAALCFFVDCRNRLHPPVGDAYFGNCQKPCAVNATTAELLVAGGLGVACAAIEKEMEECLKEPLMDCKGWLEKLIKLPRPRRVGVQAWPELRAYDAADFGWGRPRRAELVSMNHDGDVVMGAARDEEGGVQASVALSEPHIDSFAAHFLGDL